MAPLTDNDKRVRDARRVIREFRANEDAIKQNPAGNRSTNLRQVYKSGWEKLAEVERILYGK
jgi:hypothetical protein